MANDGEIGLKIDTDEIEQALENLKQLSASFGSQLTGAFKSAASGGKQLEDVLRRIGLNLAGMALQQGLQPLQNLKGGGGQLLANIFSGLAGAKLFAKGGVTPFASGGIVSAPTYFPAGGRLGLMGEAGPEAILPLQRGSDGRLGVAAGGRAASVSVVMHVNTPDAASFRKSEAQVTGMLARAASRGARTL